METGVFPELLTQKMQGVDKKKWLEENYKTYLVLWAGETVFDYFSLQHRPFINIYMLIIPREPCLTLFVYHKKKFYHFLFDGITGRFEYAGIKESISVRKKNSVHRSYKSLPKS